MKALTYTLLGMALENHRTRQSRVPPDGRCGMTCCAAPSASFYPEELDTEKDNILIAAFEDDQILGCCMLVEEQPGTVRLRQMAVLNSLQGKGIGRALMTLLKTSPGTGATKFCGCTPAPTLPASTKSRLPHPG